MPWIECLKENEEIKDKNWTKESHKCYFLLPSIPLVLFLIKNDKLGLGRDEELGSIIFILDRHKNMCTNAHFQVHCF